MGSPGPLLSPQSFTATSPNNDIWQFLDEIDAPKWVDLHEEAVLAAAGLEGDDPWFHSSHENHEKSLDELAEETGTLPLPLLHETGPFSHSPTGSPAGGHSQEATEAPQGFKPLLGEKGLSAALVDSLHRVDLRRLGGGAQRLTARALRVAPGEAPRSSASPEAEIPVQEASRSLAHPKEAHAPSVSPASSPHKPWHHARLATGAVTPHKETTSQAAATPPERPSSSRPPEGNHEEAGPAELPRERESSSGEAAELGESGDRRNGGRGMQLPVAAASRQAGGGREPAVGLSGGVGRHAGRRSLGDALRRPAEGEGTPPGLELGPKKRTPPLVARPRKSAESGGDNTEGVKLAFGRRIEQPEGDPRTRKTIPQGEHSGAGLHSRPMLEGHVSCSLPGAQRGPLGSGRANGAASKGIASKAIVKAGRQVAARTDSGNGRAGGRAPLVTLATGNTGSVPEAQTRKVAAKGTGGQHAQRVAGPRLTHAAVGFTPAPQVAAGETSKRRTGERRSAQALDTADGHMSSATRPGPSPADVTRAQSRPPGEDADLAALLAQHNRRFKAKPAYEPRMHSVRDTKQWEAVSGKTYYQLAPEEREAANEEITRMKQALATGAF
ncbi:hypothetical protein KFL_001310170 [Klebsormidium nitens]|uniref:Uncharacterized protein n=1 Tax=Klebsormidium nitens TaxID=105231 RepID=A0A1Y1I2K8_KLENI|nr:hypothetical protein KFL_001310170 [Klebsormidium nitens]|eukprot:GAQ82987.1 hypothetical protein KFL_001310170 [Klebsormidium nitens]